MKFISSGRHGRPAVNKKGEEEEHGVGEDECWGNCDRGITARVKNATC